MNFWYEDEDLIFIRAWKGFSSMQLPFFGSMLNFLRPIDICFSLLGCFISFSCDSISCTTSLSSSLICCGERKKKENLIISWFQAYIMRKTWGQKRSFDEFVFWCRKNVKKGFFRTNRKVPLGAIIKNTFMRKENCYFMTLRYHHLPTAEIIFCFTLLKSMQ